MSKEQINKNYIQKIYNRNLGDRSLQGILGGYLDGTIDEQTLVDSSVRKEAHIKYGKELGSIFGEYEAQGKEQIQKALRIDQKYAQEEMDILKNSLAFEAKNKDNDIVESNIKLEEADIYSLKIENLNEHECHKKIREFYEAVDSPDADSCIHSLNEYIHKYGNPVELFGVGISITYNDTMGVFWTSIKIKNNSFETHGNFSFKYLLATDSNKIFELLHKYAYFQNHVTEALHFTKDYESEDDDNYDDTDDRFPKK